MTRGLIAAALSCAAVAAAAEAPPAKAAPASRRIEWSTKSEAARAHLLELQKRVEDQQGGAASQELARKIVAADPEWPMGHYYLSAVSPQAQAQPHLDKALELAKKGGSEAERRLLDALALARGREPQKAIEPLTALAKDYPGERLLHVLLAQSLIAANRPAEARAALERAIAIDGSTPRAYSLIGNILILQGEYAKAREMYETAFARLPRGTASSQIRYNLAFTHLYEGQPDKAVAGLQAFVDEYNKAGQPFGLPEVFIWNSIARIHLESGRTTEAMAAYEKGYESVPRSSLDETQKKIWLGRLHHGKGRTLARMGRHEEAWKEAETIRRMIDEGGERGKQFEPAYHYVAGYLKLEAGDPKTAVTHLEKADQDDPFHKLLLARAYEKVGEKEKARKAYEDVTKSTQNTLERALAYPEARKKLATL